MTATAALASPRPKTVMDGRAVLIADPLAAADIFRTLAEADANDFEARYWLYSALTAAGEPEAAAKALDEARMIHAVAVIRSAGADMDRFATERAYCAELGVLLYNAKLMGPASIALARALDPERLDRQQVISYGLSLQHQGRMDEAIEVFSLVARLFPDAAAHEFLIYPLFHAPDRLERVAAEARHWAKLHASPPAPQKARYANERTTKRRLRIGYMGPSFTRNQLSQFLPPVLEAHDPSAVEVFLYCADPATEVGLPAGVKARAIGTLADAAVADLVRKDKIDILVDVWGHTAGSRLAVFGHRPAPIQAAWINFVQTTGLEAMDYVLHADSMNAPGVERYFTEEIWRIGPIVAPYRIAADRPGPTPTPALKNRHVTFGSFNNPAKLSESTVAAWARILCARPADKLVLKYSYYRDPVLQRVTQARFAAYGAYPEQLEFRDHTTGADYWREFADIDLALDTSPCPGGTTSCDALANGVPVLTLLGDDFYSRIGVPVVEPCGLSELIVESWDAYVQKALDLTADVQALDALRARTRAGFDVSPYRDEVGFTRNLEGHFRQMFARWLAKP